MEFREFPKGNDCDQEIHNKEKSNKENKHQRWNLSKGYLIQDGGEGKNNYRKKDNDFSCSKKRSEGIKEGMPTFQIQDISTEAYQGNAEYPPGAQRLVEKNNSTQKDEQGSKIQHWCHVA